MFSYKMCVHPAPLFLIVIIGPFKRWGISFTTFHLPSARGHRYIIVFIEYFTNSMEAMHISANDSETTYLFLFNQVITRFRVSRDISSNHGSHF
jgi:hypothetical protein